MAPSARSASASDGLSTWAVAGRAAAIGIIAFGAVAIAWGRTLGPDTYISLTAGRLIFAHGLPSVDHLSVAAAGRPWIDQQWLAHAVFYGLWRVGGNPAVAASSAVAIGAAIGMLYALCVRRGADPVSAWVGAAGALVICLMFAETRAQSFAYPLFVGLLWIVLHELDRGRFSLRGYWILPILVVWANVHGSVLVGAAVAAGCFGARGLWGIAHGRARSGVGDLGVALLAVAAVLVTPYGTAILAYYPRVLGDPALATISEWQPTSFNIPSAPYVALLAGTLGAACFARGRGLRLPSWPLVIATVLGVLATHALRYQVWFGVAAAPVLACVLSSIRTRPPQAAPTPRRITVVAVALMAVAVVGVSAVLVTTPTSRYESFVSQHAVAAAARYADTHPYVRVLADDSTGSALLWQHPELAGRIGFDARTEIYPPNRFIAFARFLDESGARWTAAARPYQVLAITCWSRPGLCRDIRRLPAWRVFQRSDGGLVAVRRTA